MYVSNVSRHVVTLFMVKVKGMHNYWFTLGAESFQWRAHGHKTTGKRASLCIKCHAGTVCGLGLVCSGLWEGGYAGVFCYEFIHLYIT